VASTIRYDPLKTNLPTFSLNATINVRRVNEKSEIANKIHASTLPVESIDILKIDYILSAKEFINTMATTHRSER